MAPGGRTATPTVAFSAVSANWRTFICVGLGHQPMGNNTMNGTDPNNTGGGPSKWYGANGNGGVTFAHGGMPPLLMAQPFHDQMGGVAVGGGQASRSYWESHWSWGRSLTKHARDAAGHELWRGTPHRPPTREHDRIPTAGMRTLGPPMLGHRPKDPHRCGQ